MTRQHVHFVCLQEEGKTPSRSHSRSHSRSSSWDSRESKYSSMSEDDFETEAKKCGWVKSSTGESSEATSKGCFGDCFGSGRKKEGAPLATVFKESNQNFEFQPQTQLQIDEEYNRRVAKSTPPNETATQDETATPTPMETPQMTPHHQ